MEEQLQQGVLVVKYVRNVDQKCRIHFVFTLAARACVAVRATRRVHIPVCRHILHTRHVWPMGIVVQCDLLELRVHEFGNNAKSAQSIDKLSSLISRTLCSLQLSSRGRRRWGAHVGSRATIAQVGAQRTRIRGCTRSAVVTDAVVVVLDPVHHTVVSVLGTRSGGVWRRARRRRTRTRCLRIRKWRWWRRRRRRRQRYRWRCGRRGNRRVKFHRPHLGRWIGVGEFKEDPRRRPVDAACGACGKVVVECVCAFLE